MLPSVVRVLRTLIGIQIYRLVGLSFLPLLYDRVSNPNGVLPAVFVIPATTGDVLTALTAPIIAIAISIKRGPRTWAAALVWNSLGLVDLFFALTLASLTATTFGSFACLGCGPPSVASYILSNDQPILVGVSLAIALHIISIILLLRKTTVDHFLNRV